MTNYIPLPLNDMKATHLKVEVYYNLGGFNAFTYKEEKRGYYLSVSPVEKRSRDGYSYESYTAFTGRKLLIKEVKRKSEKAMLTAIEQANALQRELIEYVCGQNGLEMPVLE